jgi:hypothetical protein
MKRNNGLRQKKKTKKRGEKATEINKEDERVILNNPSGRKRKGDKDDEEERKDEHVRQTRD